MNMARHRKVEEKPKDSGSLQISVEDFVRTRNSHRMTREQREKALQAVDLFGRPCLHVCDEAYKLVHNIIYGAIHPEQSQLIITPQVVTGLATLQSAVSDLSRAYIAHTDTVLGRGNTSSLEQLNLSNPLSGENGLFGGRGPTPAPTTEVTGEGKKRKRAPHDKNAPKRALTAFFLYMQTARTTIAEEMGPGHTAKEVQDEGGRRWREMTDKDKSEWQHRYAINLARYRAQTDAYKAGQAIPEISDVEAKKLYESTRYGKSPKPADIDPGHIDEEDDSDTSSDDEDEDEDEDESPGPVKAPSPKRKKTAKESAGKKSTSNRQTPAKAPEQVVAERTSQSPEMNKKKKSFKRKESKGFESIAEAQKEVVAEAASSPPKLISQDSHQKPEKKKGRKRKSVATEA